MEKETVALFYDAQSHISTGEAPPICGWAVGYQYVCGTQLTAFNFH